MVQTSYRNVDTDVLSRFCDALPSHNSVRIYGQILINIIHIKHGLLKLISNQLSMQSDIEEHYPTILRQGDLDLGIGQLLLDFGAVISF